MFLTRVSHFDFDSDMVTVLGIPMIHILAIYLEFEGAKNIHVLQVLILGFEGCWRFLTGVWHLDLDLDMVTGFPYNHDLNFGSVS